MAKTAAAIRREIEQLPGKGTGRRYPKKLRKQILDHARQRMSEGERLPAISGDLGLSEGTIVRWQQLEDHQTTAMALFEPVQLLEDSTATTAKITAYGPCGLRIEGLDLKALAELLRRLS